MLLADESTPERASSPDTTPRRRRLSFRRRCAIAALIGLALAAALAPVDIASWAGDSHLRLPSPAHQVALGVIFTLITPYAIASIFERVLEERTEMWSAAQGGMVEQIVDRVVDEKLTARRDELINVFTDLIHELIHDIEPRQRHLINEAVRNAVKPQIAEIKKGVSSGLSAATRAGLIAGAQQSAPQPRPSRRRGSGCKDTPVPTIGNVRQFRQASSD